MSNKNTALTALPLELLYEPVHKHLVKQHWNVTFSRQSKMSVAAKRIMARVLDQIKDDDYELRPFYQMRIEDVVEHTGITRRAVYNEVQAAIVELLTTVWYFESADKNEWRGRHLLDTTREESAGYKNSVITIPLNPALTAYFVNIAHYTSYELARYMSLKSWYSMRLFEILSAFKDTGFWEVAIEDYRLFMDCGPILDKRQQSKKNSAGQVIVKYPLVKDLILRTTTEALEELADTDVAFRIKAIPETGRTLPGRPKIVRLRFELLHKQQNSIPDSWLTHPITKGIIDRLRAWKVTDKNIARCAPTLGREGMLKILHEWDLKATHPTDRINSKEKYCNTALTRAAKQVLDQQKAEALQVRQDLQLGLFGAGSEDE